MSSFLSLHIGAIAMVGAVIVTGGIFQQLTRQIEKEKRRADDATACYEKEAKLRNAERTGRTTAEREIRQLVQARQKQDGFAFQAIGTVESCFGDRRGAPRQGILAPATRGSIVCASSIPPASLECLDRFSHIWVVFVFHENTNAVKLKNKQTAAAAGAGRNNSQGQGAGGEGGGEGEGGVRAQKGQKKKLSKGERAAANGGAVTFQAKIAPPRLGGKRVGLFSTRSPHRPNPIGLTLVKLDRVEGKRIYISGLDLVHGTPVLDVKPYCPLDRLPLDGFRFPDWVDSEAELGLRVRFLPAAVEAIEGAVCEGALRFYSSTSDVLRAVEQVLRLDPRSVHQGRGRNTRTVPAAAAAAAAESEASASPSSSSSSTSSSSAAASSSVSRDYECNIDNLRVVFRTGTAADGALWESDKGAVSADAVVAAAAAADGTGTDDEGMGGVGCGGGEEGKAEPPASVLAGYVVVVEAGVRE